MIIRCWGSRGSIAVSGKDTLRYGGDTTCLEVESIEGDILVLDAGTGIRRLGNRLKKDGVKTVHILFTHAHWDHIIGFPFFKPLFDPQMKIFLYGGRVSQELVTNFVKKTMCSPTFPIPMDAVHATVESKEIAEEAFQIQNLTITPICLNHPNGGFGYKITEDQTSFVFLTDNELNFSHPGGYSRDTYVSFAENSDLLIHDAEFCPDEYKATRGWGHSCYTDVTQLAIDAQVKTLGLFHHNQDRTDEDLDNILQECRNEIQSKKSSVVCTGVKQGDVFQL